MTTQDTPESIDINKRITISDVAKAAGVSLATVSRVINQAGIVKESTHKKVMDAINQLGYEVDKNLLAMPNGKLIIFNLPSIDNPFYSNVLKGVKMSAAQHGYQLLVSEGLINQNTLPGLQSIIKKSHVIGMLTCNHIPTAELKQLNEMIPIVQCCEYNEVLDISFVSIDDIQASINVVKYLSSIGKNRIALLNGPESYKYSRHRLQGYQIGLDNCGLPYDPNLVITLPDIHYDLAISTVMQLVNSPNPPDAFFASSDVFAIAALRAIHLAGYKVPEDFSVVGFDNIDVTSALVPSITTVNQPQLQIGFTSCELLHEKIQNPDAPTKKVLLETELIIRESTK